MLTGLETALLAGGTALIGAAVSAIIAMVSSGRSRVNGRNGNKVIEHKLDDLKAGQTEMTKVFANHISGLDAALNSVADSMNEMATTQAITNVILKERLPRRGDS